MKPIHKLVILDEFLETHLGHYYEYDKAVMQAFQVQQIPCVIYGKKTVIPEIQNELQVIPHFHYNPRAWVRKIPVLGALIYRFQNWRSIARQIETAIQQELESDKQVVFFVPNIFWFNVIPYTRTLVPAGVSGALLYRTSVFEAQDIVGAFKPLILAIQRMGIRRFQKAKALRFMTDSEVIAEEFTQHFHTPMTVLPIPHVFEVPLLPKTQSDTFRFSLPGGARFEKGILTITEALEWMQQYQPELIRKVCLVIQFFGEKEKELIADCIQRIQKLDAELVVLGKLSSAAYQEQFNLSQVILIPYLNRKGYRARTSGILAEAIAGAKPFITTSHSWMDYQVKRYQTGIAVPDEKPKELAEAMIQLMNAYEVYRTRAVEARSAWIQFHDKASFLKQFRKAFSDQA